MNINNLPVTTFNTMGMNGTELSYTPGEVIKNIINSDAVVTVDKAGDYEYAVSVADNASMTVVFDYNNSDTLNIVTNVTIGKNASLKLIQIDGACAGNMLINRVKADIDVSGSMHLVQIFPGSGDVYADCDIELNGDKSDITIDAAHLTGSGQVMDLNYVINHYGKNTNSKLLIDGAVRENGNKTVRDTIEFKTGSSGSVGAENEKVYLLGDDLINKSIPLILCSEEDVAGTHGAAIGNLDEDMLFYLSSRCIDEEEAKRMLTYANLARLLRFIDDTELMEKTDKLIMENINA